MTLDEAIIHCEEVADKCAVADRYIECAKEHRQLAEWLKELKEYRKEIVKAVEECREVVATEEE